MDDDVSSSDSGIYGPPPQRTKPTPPVTRPSAAGTSRRHSRPRRQEITRGTRPEQKEAVERRTVRRYAAAVADAEKRRKQGTCALTLMSSVPAASPSQRWCTVMRQIISRSLSRLQGERMLQDEAVGEVGPGLSVTRLPVQGEGRGHVLHGEGVFPGYKSLDDGNDAASRCATIAKIAIKARCRDALTVLRYLQKLREERSDEAAGFEWLQANTRCSAVYELLASVPAIHTLDSVFQRKLLPHLELEHHPLGAIIFRQGDEEETIWLILEGKVCITSRDKGGIVHHVAELDEGQVMGNMLREVRLATATCTGQCALLRIDSIRFRRALDDPEAVADVAKKEFFRSVSLFQALGENDIDRLASAFREKTVEAGKVICTEGQRVDQVFLIKRGSCRLLKAFLPRRGGGNREEGEEDCGETKRKNTTGTVLRQTTNGSATLKSSGTRRETIAASNRRKQEKEETISVRHFDVGVLGRKEFLGDGGFKAAACAEAGRRGDSSSFPGDTRPGGRYLISAFTEQGVDLYAARVTDLLPLQTAGLKLCWVEGWKHHDLRELGWRPGVLAAKIQRQLLWERAKGTLLLDCVDAKVLERGAEEAIYARGKRGAGSSHIAEPFLPLVA